MRVNKTDVYHTRDGQVQRIIIWRYATYDD